ncbi:MAG: deoxyribose-phosphate aldolase [Bacteroidota bacterium]
MRLQSYIDHTLLRPMATINDIKNLCAEAKTYGFYAICVHGGYLSTAKKELSQTNIKLAAVMGFPLGAMSTSSKIFEAKDCMANGADELDMVINMGWLKSGKVNKVREEIEAIKETIGNKVLKVIIETCYLTNDEKRVACNLAVAARADFVKTSTGFGTAGATFDDVRLMIETVGNKAQIKASGGIKDYATAQKYIELGVSRIGTSSGVAMVTTHINPKK